MDVPQATEDLIRSTLSEVGDLLRKAFDAVGHQPVAGSALDQAGLVDGVSIVEDYMDHNEQSIALDHLIYMIHEPGLQLSPSAYAAIAEAGQRLGLPAANWERICPSE